MTDRSSEHDTFVLERRYDAPRSRVFEAWAVPEHKVQWWGMQPMDYGLDFRVGGLEHMRAVEPDDDSYSYEATYRDIVADERIVYTYFMCHGPDLISVSVATVELADDGHGTRLVLTEQGVFLDGHDHVAQRQAGTEQLLDSLGRALEAAAV
jgi:uncharacterized protein YndB with AHSA1/START domain